MFEKFVKYSIFKLYRNYYEFLTNVTLFFTIKDMEEHMEDGLLQNDIE